MTRHVEFKCQDTWSQLRPQAGKRLSKYMEISADTQDKDKEKFRKLNTLMDKPNKRGKYTHDENSTTEKKE